MAVASRLESMIGCIALLFLPIVWLAHGMGMAVKKG